MRYGIFDKNGRIETAVNDETIDKLPKGKRIAELTDEQWENRFDLLFSGTELINDPLPKAANVNSND